AGGRLVDRLDRRSLRRQFSGPHARGVAGKPARRFERSHDYSRIAISASVSRAAANVCLTCSSVWTADRNAASNWLHGKYTPRAIIAQKKRANRAVSLLRAAS